MKGKAVLVYGTSDPCFPLHASAQTTISHNNSRIPRVIPKLQTQGAIAPLSHYRNKIQSDFGNHKSIRPGVMIRFRDRESRLFHKFKVQFFQLLTQDVCIKLLLHLPPSRLTHLLTNFWMVYQIGKSIRESSRIPLRHQQT